MASSALALAVVAAVVSAVAISRSGRAPDAGTGRGDEKVLIVLNRNPYDGTDVTWNALRLTGKLKDDGADVRPRRRRGCRRRRSRWATCRPVTPCATILAPNPCPLSGL